MALGKGHRQLFGSEVGTIFAMNSAMPRANLIRTDQYPYHVTVRTTRKAFFEIPLSKIYDIFEIWINLTHHFYGIKTHHFVLMSNHIHWLLTTPRKNIDTVMRYILSNVAKHVNEKLGTFGQLWGGRYKYSIINTEEAYFAVMKYVYRNPVKANIVTKVERYPFSTIQYLYGTGVSRINVFKDPISTEIAYDNEFLEWINVPFHTEDVDQIAKSLEKYEFKFRRTSRSKRYEIKVPWVPKSCR